MKNLIALTLLSTTFTGFAFADEDADPAEIAIGERLFLETRFAQSWYVNPGKADPALKETLTTGKSLRGAFAGGTMNCRACHMVDEHQEEAGMRTYADFARLSPIPDRGDGKKKTGRNSMSLVNINKDDVDNILFHFDGEFNSLEELVIGTLTGRNYGWRADEKAMAIKHIAKTVRSDDGKGELAQEFGGSYRKILGGTAKVIPAELRLPAEYRINVDTASDLDVAKAVARLIAAYTGDLGFAVDEQGNYEGSPYDAFLKSNKLPMSADKNETATAYGQRLVAAVNKISSPRFIQNDKKYFETHKQAFRFGDKELRGMKLFFSKGSATQSGGNCASCHQAPHFTDFRFHNTGITQNTYDAVHGQNSFNMLAIPGLKKRNQDPERYLPATSQHPDARAPFRSPVSKDKPGYTDLGLWNIAVNPAVPGPQKKIKAIMCGTDSACSNDSLLQNSIATFKTPTVRDTGHSAPYMHTGALNTLKDVVTRYIQNSVLVRQGKLRNGDDELEGIYLSSADADDLVAFLNALNEDYD